MATGQTDRELLLALMRNPGVLPNVDPFTYPQNAPNVPKIAGQQLLDFAQALERDPNRRVTGLEEVVELIGKMGVINPLKTAGSLMQLDKPTVERMAQSGVEAAKRAYDDPSGTARRVAQGAKEALLDPVGTAGELSFSDVTGGGLLSNLVAATIPARGAAFTKMLEAIDNPIIREKAAQLKPGSLISPQSKLAQDLFLGHIQDEGERAMRATSFRNPPGVKKGQDPADFLGPTPRVLEGLLQQKLIDPNSKILDLGAGIRANAAEGLTRKGFSNVSALELPENVEIGRFFNALGERGFDGARLFKSLEELKPQDIVMLQNVLNVQRRPEDLNEILDFAISRLSPEGKILANFPTNPRRLISDPLTKQKIPGFFDEFETDKASTEYLYDLLGQKGLGNIQKIVGGVAPIFMAGRTKPSAMVSGSDMPKQTDLKQFFVEQGGVRVPLPDKNFGVGKKIGNDLYVHKSAEDVIPVDILNNARRLIGDFPYDVVKYNKKDNSISFIESPNFDTSSEPIIGNSIKVNADGSVSKPRKGGNVIYHHKWNMVRPDYDGFDYNESMLRSAQWTSALEGTGINRNKIGNKNYWDSNVLPLLGE